MVRDGECSGELGGMHGFELRGMHGLETRIRCMQTRYTLSRMKRKCLRL